MVGQYGESFAKRRAYYIDLSELLGILFFYLKLKETKEMPVFAFQQGSRRAKMKTLEPKRLHFISALLWLRVHR